MAKLSRIVNPTTEQDPLPLFMVWNSQNVGYDIYDSYFGHVTSGSVNTNSELWSAYSGWTQTNSAITSNSSSYFIQSGTSNFADGNCLLSAQTMGGRNAMLNRNPDSIVGWWNRNLVIIPEEGMRPQFSIHVNNNGWHVVPRGATATMDQVDGNNAAIRDIGSYGSSYGAGSYNQRTRTLCIIMTSGSNNYRAYFWKHPTIDLMAKNFKTGQFYQFLTEAKAGTNGASYFYNDFSWSTTNSTSYSESLYKMKVVMGDNGLVGLARMTPSNQTVSGYFTPGANGAAVSVTNLVSLGLTTSYGYDNGEYYGQRHQVTWDGNWVAAFSQYYYYGSGLNAHFIYAKDPSKQYYRQEANTSYGYGLLPIQEDKFLLSYHQNNDSNAEMSFAFADPNGHLVNGTDSGGGTIANGGPVAAWWVGSQLDTWYTSTNYSSIVAVGNWYGGSR